MTETANNLQIRYNALVDLALDKHNYSQLIRQLFSDPRNSTDDSQQALLSAIYAEKRRALPGLADKGFECERLLRCIDVEDEGFNLSRAHLVMPQHLHDWTDLFAEELCTVAGLASWQPADLEVALHAAKGLYFYCSETAADSLRDHHRTKLAPVLQVLFVRATQDLSPDIELSEVHLAAEVCRLINLLGIQELHRRIIAIEPHVRSILLQYKLSDGEPEDVEPFGITNTAYFNQLQREHQIVLRDAWSDLHNTTVYPLVLQAHDPRYADHYLEVLDETSPNSIFWPSLLQSLAICSPEKLRSYLPKLITKTINDDDALACLFHVLALKPTAPATVSHIASTTHVDPVSLVAEYLTKCAPPVRRDFFSHAQELLRDSRYRLEQIEHPSELLQRLQSQVTNE